MADCGHLLVTLTGHVRAEHDWIARDGKAWAFRLIQVILEDLPGDGVRVAALLSEDDL